MYRNLLCAPRARAFLISTAFALVTTFAHAQTALPSKDLVPTDDPNPVFSDWGAAVSLLGGRAVVGSLWLGGGLYIFEQSGNQWIQKQHLETPNVDPERGKGMGDLIVQDATGILTTDSTYGYVYYFEKSSAGDFRPKAILSGGRVGIGDFASTNIDMSGCQVVVGAFARPIDQGPRQPGAVHLFDRCNGSMPWRGSLSAPGGFAGDEFSKSIALVGNEMLVGAPGMDGGAGAVFYYTYNGTKWVLKQRFTQAHPAAGNKFGTALSFRNGLAVISAPTQPDVGQAEVFKRGSNGVWTSQGLLPVPSSDGTWKRYGSNLTVTPDRVAVAAVAIYPDALGAQVFVYKRAGDVITLQNELSFPTASRIIPADVSLAVNGRGLIVGNPQAVLHEGRTGGKVTIFQLLP